METRSVDLHVHSTESDGTDLPEELIRIAKAASLSAIAITDHDTVSGIEKARAIASELSIELIPGVELSTDYEGKEIHMLGFFLDDKDPVLLERLEYFRSSRLGRNEKMYQKLREHGFSITQEDLTLAFPDSVLTRAHVARYLLDSGQVRSMDQVFEKYIGDGGPCYVKREKLSPREGIQLIHQAKGLAVLAHPLTYRLSRSALEALIKDCSSWGLDGLEAIYSTHALTDEHYIKRLARSYSLLISGGSDYHGSNKPLIHMGKGMGQLFVSYSVLDRLKELSTVKRS